MLNTLFQICSLTVTKIPLDENNLKLFYRNSSMDILTSTCNFVLMVHKQITHDDAEGLVFQNLVIIYILYQTKQMISVIYP